MRASARFPLTAVGDVNTYALFAEHAHSLLAPTGRAGIIVPTGIATDDSTKAFFANTMLSQTLERLIGFENEAFIFPEVHNEFKFCAFTMTGKNMKISRAHFIFLCRYFDQINQKERHFELTREDLKLLNPNTLTCPVFRTHIDAELTKKIYQRAPVMLDEKRSLSPWDITYMRMFDMANDSGLFRSKEQMIKEAFEIGGNTFRKMESFYSPVYEAKMFWQYDHRFASLVGVENAGHRPSRKYEGWYGVVADDPAELPIPRYWINLQDVRARVTERWNKKWLLGFRRVANIVTERTSIFCLLPLAGMSDSIFLLLPKSPQSLPMACLLATTNSLTFDYVTRQKLGGNNLNFFVVN